MPYIIRSTSGQIEGFTRWPQSEGQEFLPDDDPEVLATKKRRTEAERIEPRIQNDLVLRRLVSVLADEFGKTPRQIIDAIKAKP